MQLHRPFFCQLGPKHYLCSNFPAMPSIELQLTTPITLHTLERIFRKWLEGIEMDAEEYEVKSTPAPDPERAFGRLEVTYRQKTLFFANFYKKYLRTEAGKRSIQGMVTVRRRNDGRLLTAPGETLTLNIDDHWRVNYNGKQAELADALQDVLPIRDEAEVQRIMETLRIGPEHIRMDSFQKRYVVDIPIPELQWEEEPEPALFYKYVPLEVFHKMLLNGSFRMNSIVSQSDREETFFLGDLLCADYEDELKRFAGVLREQTVLISSFTTEYDSSKMWKEYAGEGRGVCLCFSLIGRQTLHQVQYVNRSSSPLMKLKESVLQLKADGICVHFSAVDDCHRFVKDDKFGAEKEWRLIIDYEKEVDYELYENGTRCVAYKEFKFEGRDLPDIGLRLDSVLIGPKQPSGADNFPLLTQRAQACFGKDLIVNRSKCKVS